MATIKKAQSGSKLKKDEFKLKVLQFQETQKQNAINNEREARKRAEKNIEKRGRLDGKKMKNGGSLSGLTASNRRDNGIDPKGSWTKVQKKTLAGARGKAKLTADKQLGATKMAKRGMRISKKK
jgi:hypothetical protein